MVKTVMGIEYRAVNREDQSELSFIAEQDSKIPLLYDSDYRWNTKAVENRLEMYRTRIQAHDFFEVAAIKNKIIGFYIVSKVPYPPDLFAGLVITLWVDSNYRGKGIGTRLKENAEKWANDLKLDHLQTGVHINNSQMLSINEKMGFETIQHIMKKKL